MENNMVMISTDEYSDLINDSQTLGFLLDGIFSDCSLNWNGTKLSFNEDTLNVVLKIFSPSIYHRWLKTLKAERKESE